MPTTNSPRFVTAGSFLLLLCLAVVVAPQMVQGLETYQSRLPNGDKVKVNGVACSGIGHSSCGGSGATNAFGNAFRAASYSWTGALCRADSDGDGMTNGQELGDPNCVWTVGATPARTTDITHPGQSGISAAVSPQAFAAGVIATAGAAFVLFL